jgi:hypothetical protein
MRPDLEPESQPHAFPLDTLRGVFRVFLLFDVAEEIDLETVRRRVLRKNPIPTSSNNVL